LRWPISAPMNFPHSENRKRTMQIENLTQGTPEWHAYRAAHWNASDAPAMLGCSPYKSRSELLREMATGITAEIDAATERRFQDGHRFEGLARPLAEEIIGEELAPLVGSKGKYSASFDGLTLGCETGFEHKSLNNTLRECMAPGSTGADLPEPYRVQMEQQIMVSGCERILFMASQWNPDGELVEARHCWYTPDSSLRARIEAGWAQFERDLAGYVPQAAPVEAVGRAPEQLPALRIEVSGKVTASNLSAFKDYALAAFSVINRNLNTDQEFADAEKTVKWCGEVEERLAAAKRHALSQTTSIDELFRTIDDISAEARRVRLELDKLVKNRKESIRAAIVTDAMQALKLHVAGLDARIGEPFMPAVPADFAGAIKGKKNLDSMRGAVETELARAKIEANAIADRIQANLRAIEACANATLFPDVAMLVLKASDDLDAIIAMRKAEAERRLEQRERLRKEAAEKLAAQEAACRTQMQAQAAPVVEHAQATNPVVEPVAAPQAPQTPSGPPTLRLGQINARLSPIALSADGLASLGFAQAATDKAAKLYHEGDFPEICDALIRHIQVARAAAQ